MARHPPSHPDLAHKKRIPVIPIKLSDVRETDEYEAEAARISDVYREKPVHMKPGNVGKCESLRERILSMSLFPNLYSARHLMPGPN